MAPAGPRRGRRGRATLDRLRGRRGRRRILLLTGITGLAAMVAVVLLLKSMSPQADGQVAASTQVPSPTPTPLAVGHPAVAALPTASPVPSSARAAAGRPVPTGVPGHWKLIFDDEFNGTSLDTSKWSTGWFGAGITPPVNHNERECYDPAQVAVGNGALSLTMIAKSESCGISNPEYASGLVSTAGKFSYTYGLLEARVWLPPAAGTSGQIANWPSVWTDGQVWPVDGEDDVLEGLGGQACAHFHSSVDSSGLGAGGGNGCAGRSYAGGWHTFAADWEPGVVTYYYDGANVGSVTEGVTSAPMFIVLSYAAGKAYPQAPATMKVDYVRVWQHP